MLKSLNTITGMIDWVDFSKEKPPENTPVLVYYQNKALIATFRNNVWYYYFEYKVYYGQNIKWWCYVDPPPCLT